MGRALEPNAFYEPAFALSAARCLPAKSRPLFLTVWGPAGNGEEMRLICLCPITPPASLLGDGLVRAWLRVARNRRGAASAIWRNARRFR